MRHTESVPPRERVDSTLIARVSRGATCRYRWLPNSSFGACVAAEPSRPEALAVFNRGNERFDHLGVPEVAVELVQLSQPEIIAGVISIGRVVRISS